MHSSLDSERIASLDVLRGFALLGILLMNIQSFSMPSAAYLNPYAYGDLEGVNYWVWLISHVFADQKFMSLFSMLFGVGIVVFSQRLESKGMSPTGLHYRRTAWLLLFGILHGYLLWYGDILYSYAVCGFIVYLLRNRTPKTLFILGALTIAIGSSFNILSGLAIPNLPPEALAGINESWKPDNQFIQQQISQYTTSYTSAFTARLTDTFFMQTYVFLSLFIWRAGGLMLMGMALYKSGFFTLKYSNRFYIQVAILCTLAGLGLTLFGVEKNTQHQYSLAFSMFLGSQFNYWGSAFMAFGYASVIMLIVKNRFIYAVQKRLASVGQMAFTNYILHSVICTTLFYSLGYFGEFSRLEQLLLVLVIWAIQLALSPVWLHHFKFGPLEWLWRSLTYRSMQPIKRTREQ